MNIVVNQIYFNSDQASRLEPEFVPYNNSRPRRNGLFEFLPMYEYYRSGKLTSEDLVGFVSYKFSSKSGINGKTFFDFIRQNPGYDVYFVNPFPHLPYLSYNVWDHGEFWHPGIKDLATIVFDRIDFQCLPNHESRHDVSITCYSNFWAGNINFWSQYGIFIEKIFDLMNRDKILSARLLTPAPYIGSQEVGYFAFIFERMFTSFLANCKGVKYKGFPADYAGTLASCFNESERQYIADNFDVINHFDTLGKFDKLRVLTETSNHNILKVTQDQLANLVPERLR